MNNNTLFPTQSLRLKIITESQKQPVSKRNINRATSMVLFQSLIRSFFFLLFNYPTKKFTKGIYNIQQFFHPLFPRGKITWMLNRANNNWIMKGLYLSYYNNHWEKNGRRTKKKKIHTVGHPMAILSNKHCQGLGGIIGLVSSNFPASSSPGILLQPEFLIDNILARSSPVPLNPVILDDIIGITRTEDALMVSSPRRRDNAQEFCK